MKDLLKTIVNGLVDHPEDVSITEDPQDEEGVIIYHLHVNEEETGRIIGKQGRIIKAIRVVMRAVGVKNSCKVVIKVD